MAEENTEAKYRWDEFPYVKTAEDLENYIKYRYGKGKTDKYQNLRAYNHGGFFHYTKLSCIENILKSKSFFLDNPGESNDPEENVIPNKEYKFYFCFSTGNNENLPLWYLYSGVNGKGGRLSLKKAQVYDLIEKGTYSLVIIDKEYNTVKNPLGEELVCSLEKDDYRCILQDVIYYGDKKNGKYVNLLVPSSAWREMALSMPRRRN